MIVIRKFIAHFSIIVQAHRKISVKIEDFNNATGKSHGQRSVVSYSLWGHKSWT